MTNFPYDNFPIYVEHVDGKDHKRCWFQCQEHFEKYIAKSKLKPENYVVEYRDELPKQSKRGRKPRQQLFSSIEQFFEPNEKPVASVGKGTRRKGTQKGSRSRSSRNT